MKIKLKKYQDTAESVKPDSRYEKLESDPPLTCVLQTKLVLKKHKYKKKQEREGRFGKHKCLTR